MALLALPLVGLALLIAVPELDLHWEHQPSHFWIVLVSAALSAVLAYATNAAAARHRDARVILVSLAFLVAAGFLGLHALATPGVLLHGPNTGFTIATPVGLTIAAVLRGGVGHLARRPARRGGPPLAPDAARAHGRRRSSAGASSRSPGCRRSTVPCPRARARASWRRSRSSASRSTGGRRGACSTCIGRDPAPSPSRSPWASSCSPRRWSPSRSAATGTSRGGSGTC